jgi:hypothetical protein
VDTHAFNQGLKLQYPSGNPWNTFKHDALTMDFELKVNLDIVVATVVGKTRTWG